MSTFPDDGMFQFSWGPDTDAVLRWNLNNNLARIATALERIADAQEGPKQDLFQMPLVVDPMAEPGIVEVHGPDGALLGHIDLGEADAASD